MLNGLGLSGLFNRISAASSCLFGNRQYRLKYNEQLVSVINSL